MKKYLREDEQKMDKLQKSIDLLETYNQDHIIKLLNTKKLNLLLKIIAKNYI